MKLTVDIQKSVDNFSLNAAFTLQNRRSGVFGPSGSGKSTIMMMIAGLNTPDKGRITLGETVLFDSTTNTNLPPEKRHVGVVFQHSHLFPNMTVQKNLFYGYSRIPEKDRSINVDKLIQILQLDTLLQRQVGRLSGGEKQRVALGRTILAHPRLMLLDEPLTGLDEELKYQIIPYLKEVFSEFSIPYIFISHSMQEMRMMTEEVLVIQKGVVERQISSEELAQRGLGSGGKGYINLLELGEPRDHDHLLAYDWGETELIRIKGGTSKAGQYYISSKDIMLCKKHPEATSARNTLSCIVTNTYQTDWLTGVELNCNGKKLVAEIVPQSVQELGIKQGAHIIAVFKASAIQRLC